MTFQDALDLLRLRADYTREELRARFSEAMRRHHPDRGGDPAVARRLIEAKELLERELDRPRTERPAPPPPPPPMRPARPVREPPVRRAPEPAAQNIFVVHARRSFRGFGIAMAFALMIATGLWWVTVTYFPVMLIGSDAYPAGSDSKGRAWQDCITVTSSADLPLWCFTEFDSRAVPAQAMLEERYRKWRARALNPIGLYNYCRDAGGTPSRCRCYTKRIVNVVISTNDENLIHQMNKLQPLVIEYKFSDVGYYLDRYVCN